VVIGPGANAEGMNWYSERVDARPSSGASSRKKAWPPSCWISSSAPAVSMMPLEEMARSVRPDQLREE
jgi:hypothetical protein